ncbi:transposase [Streptomyces sp. NPDC088560]|uniref:transposase n=1 Tax=Streptomyces sp. NPDC088560 TaxID=3365868 RepID=UPI003818C738
MLAAILFVAASGCTWRQTPESFGPAWSTGYRRFGEWTSVVSGKATAYRAAGGAPRSSGRCGRPHAPRPRSARADRPGFPPRPAPPVHLTRAPPGRTQARGPCLG